MKTNDMSLKTVYLNIVESYNHFTHNSRDIPLDEDIKIIGDTIISIYNFICGKSDMKYEEWNYVNPNLCVMVINKKLTNITAIIRTTKEAKDTINCRFRFNSNGLSIKLKNKQTKYVEKTFKTKKPNGKFIYQVRDYIRSHMSDEVRCWLLLDNRIKGVI